MGYFPGLSISIDVAAMAAVIFDDYARPDERNKSQVGVEADGCMHSQRQQRL
jgi:hypothetical protein